MKVGDTREAEGVKVYVYVTLVVLVALVVGWVYWLDRTMGGHGRRSVGRVDAGLVFVDTSGPGADYVRPTLMRVGFPTATPALSPTSAPVVTATPTPVLPVVTRTSIPAMTPSPVLLSSPTLLAGDAVQVVVSSYWPDDGPDWCLTWDEAAGRCVSPLTSGDDFRALEGRALACDPGWLGRRVFIPDLNLTLSCLDTGVSFRCGGGALVPCTVGLLSSSSDLVGEYAAWLLR